MSERGAGPGPLALVGSGEYLPVMAGVEGALIAGRPARYVQLATAAAPEGAAVLDRWHRLGREQAARLGVEQVVVDVRDRADADDPAMAALVDGAGLVYLSGGSPSYLAETLAGTAVWAAIVTAWEGGAALAGCSAGAMAVGGRVPVLRSPERPTVPGLGLLPHLRVIPHFDRMLGWVPDLVTRTLADVADSVSVVGIDEETALVGGPYTWEVQGRQQVWLLSPAARTPYPVGSVVETPPVAAQRAK
jgi:cyanophycinase-like exopeptidase